MKNRNRLKVICLAGLIFLAGVIININSSYVYYYKSSRNGESGIYRQLFINNWSTPLIKKISQNATWKSEFALSSNSKYMAYICVQDSIQGICLMEMDILPNTKMLISEKNSNLDFSIAGKIAWGKTDEQLYFLSKEVQSIEDGWYIYKLELNKQVLKKISDEVFHLPESYEGILGKLEYITKENKLMFYDVEKKLILFDLNSGKWEVILDEGATASVSKIGNELAYISSPDQSNGLVIRNLATNQDEIVVSNDDIQCTLTPKYGLTWSPDGKFIIFFDNCGERDHTVPYLLDLETREVSRLDFQGKSWYLNPVWVP